jgi:hypothetical protein
MNGFDKLEYFSLSSLSSLIQCLQVWIRPAVVELSGLPLYARFVALTANIRLSWKGLPRTYTLAYYRMTTFLKNDKNDSTVFLKKLGYYKSRHQ